MIGYVYLILQLSTDGLEELHKIGTSKHNPSLRLKQLSTGNANPLTLINSYSSENYKKIEKWLHKRYANSKTLADNEFFNLTNEQVLSFIDDCKIADKTITILKENNPFYK